MLRAYEAMVIFAPTLDDAVLEAAVGRIARLIGDGGGTVDRIDAWGKRRLAYEIAGQRDGVYVVVNFHAEAPVVDEFNRVLRLSDEVIRHLVVQSEELPAPSAEGAADGSTAESADGSADGSEEAPKAEAALGAD